ncbi:CorA family divalent cation transporter [Thiothrix unzii]|uniref:CorA family divalent cation transporter n=1 Tax=Thiothrix unzii TaxID=111769 RepID=UPI001FE28282|nr:CorA family divalent cation transporter [Thiothrix unzii]
METFGKRYHPPGTPPGTLSRHGTETASATRISLLEYSDSQFSETLSPTPEQCRIAQQNAYVDWLDVTGVNDPAAIRELGETFGLHPLALEDVLNSGQRPKIDFTEHHAFLVLNLPHLVGDEILLEQVSLFVGKGHLLSFCSGDGKAFEPVRERLRKQQRSFLNHKLDKTFSYQ